MKVEFPLTVKMVKFCHKYYAEKPMGIFYWKGFDLILPQCIIDDLKEQLKEEEQNERDNYRES